MKGTLAGILLTIGFLIRIIGGAMVSATLGRGSMGAEEGIMIVNLISIVLWMSGSFLLAVHLKLDFLWGFAGFFFIFGLMVMYFFSPERRERRARRKYPFDDPNYGAKGERQERRRDDERKPRTYDY